MNAKAPSPEGLTLNINEEIHVKASPEATFTALLEQVGPHHELEPGKPLSMKLEAWPGGRWYRDLGDGNGHCWGHVQSIKKAALLEISGPLMMSYPTVSSIQYRLTAVEGGTLIKFHHMAMGPIQDGHRQGFLAIWPQVMKSVKARAEAR